MVSYLSWSERTRGLHVTASLAEFKARLACFTALGATLGSGIPSEDRCVPVHAGLLRQVTERGGSARAHVPDRMIDATALAHDFVVVTRDAVGFAQLDGLVQVEVR